jgi:hypothetical protein
METIPKWGLVELKMPTPGFEWSPNGITLRRVKRENLLQTNLMLPPVGKVIFVDPHFFPAEVEVTQSYLVRIVFEADPPSSPDPIQLPPNEELM